MGVRHRELLRRGRAVPSRVDPDARGQAAARELPRRSSRTAGRAMTIRRRASRRARRAARDLAEDEMRGRRRRDHRRAARRRRRSARLLVALRMKGETVDEIAGAARAMRARADARSAARRRASLDTCGTGGDGARHVQRLDRGGARRARRPACASPSTATARCPARSAAPTCSRRSACASTLAPAVAASASTSRASASCSRRRSTGACGTRPAPRRELGMRTIFNLLGPLANPAGATPSGRSASSRRSWVEPLAQVLLGASASSDALVVHGDDGLDEISLAAPTTCRRASRRAASSSLPHRAGGLRLRRAPLGERRGGERGRQRGAASRRVLAGEAGPRARRRRCLNAAAALLRRPSARRRSPPASSTAGDAVDRQARGAARARRRSDSRRSRRA